MDEKLSAYRTMLLDTLRFLNESYDKMLVTLAGGALALSITFLKDVIELEKVSGESLLFFAWLGFILSLASVLGRILFGIEAYRHAIKQVDNGTIYDAKVGGTFSSITRGLHMTSAIFLLIGLICIASFSYINVGDMYGTGETEAETNSSTEAK